MEVTIEGIAWIIGLTGIFSFLAGMLLGGKLKDDFWLKQANRLMGIIEEQDKVIHKAIDNKLVGINHVPPPREGRGK